MPPTAAQADSSAPSLSGNRVVDAFARLRSEGRKGLMPFICGGFPGPGDTAAAIVELAGAGATVIEVGIPFSDPVADGPVIAAAMHEALAGGVTVDGVLGEVAEARRRLGTEGGDAAKVGIVAMVSMSIVHRRGVAAFAARCRASGIDGLIVPDLPVEEAGEVSAACAAEGLTLSLLVGPATRDERVGRIARSSTGFVYLLARAGVTGERAEMPDVGPAVARVRAALAGTGSEAGVACGFGISTPEHVRAVVEHADAAIVGSAVVRAMRGGSGEDGARTPAGRAAELLTSLARGIG